MVAAVRTGRTSGATLPDWGRLNARLTAEDELDLVDFGAEVHSLCFALAVIHKLEPKFNNYGAADFPAWLSKEALWHVGSKCPRALKRHREAIEARRAMFRLVWGWA